MLTSSQYNLYENSISYANTLAGLETFLAGFKRIVGKFLLLFCYYTIFWPFVLTFALWLNLERRSFQKKMKRDFKEFETSNDYLKHKKVLMDLKSLEPRLKRISNYQPHRLPFGVSYTLNNMKKMTSTLLTVISWSESRLSSLNHAKFASANHDVKFVSESELWKNRNSAYQYWM